MAGAMGRVPSAARWRRGVVEVSQLTPFLRRAFLRLRTSPHAARLWREICVRRSRDEHLFRGVLVLLTGLLPCRFIWSRIVEA